MFINDHVHAVEFDDEAPTVKMARTFSAIPNPVTHAKPRRYELRANGFVYRSSTSLQRLFEHHDPKIKMPNGAQIFRGKTLVAEFVVTCESAGGRVVGHWMMTPEGIGLDLNSEE